MGRTTYNDPDAESMYQYGNGQSKKMPDAIVPDQVEVGGTMVPVYTYGQALKAQKNSNTKK